MKGPGGNREFNMSAAKLGRSRAADYKAPGGKLVRVQLKEEQGLIRSVKLTGDSFSGS